MTDHRTSTKKALDGFFAKQAKQLDREMNGGAPRKKNEAPEHEVNKALRDWFARAGWIMQRVESKAVYNAQAGRFLNGMTDKYTSDWMGCDVSGHAVFVEAKAPGKLRTLSEGQREYLTARILKGAFACAADSVDLLQTTYTQWACLTGEEGKAFLLTKLPPIPTSRKDSPNNEMGF